MFFRPLLLALCLSASVVFYSPSARSETTEAIDGDVIGKAAHYKIQPKDTLYKIARQFDIGIVALLMANPGVDLWVPHPGADLILPTQHVLPVTERRGIVINLSEMRLYYFPNPQTVMTFPVGIGMDGWETVMGDTAILKKRKNPTWIPPESIREEDPTLPEMIPPGPNNPLGDYALNLGMEDYRIHGTNRPDGIGRRSSHGCIRLYPEDIAVLFDAVEVGVPVSIIDRPYKLGWQQDTLFLEVTPSLQQADGVVRQEPLQISDIPEIYGDIQSIAKTENINWQAVREAVMWRNSLPVAIAIRNKP